VAVVEQLEGARVAALHELHHLLVGQIADVACHSRFPTREEPFRMIRRRDGCEEGEEHK
jgi:hypothetical protein